MALSRSFARFRFFSGFRVRFFLGLGFGGLLGSGFGFFLGLGFRGLLGSGFGGFRCGYVELLEITSSHRANPLPYLHRVGVVWHKCFVLGAPQLCWLVATCVVASQSDVRFSAMGAAMLFPTCAATHFQFCVSRQPAPEPQCLSRRHTSQVIMRMKLQRKNWRWLKESWVWVCTKQRLPAEVCTIHLQALFQNPHLEITYALVVKMDWNVPGRKL